MKHWVFTFRVEPPITETVSGRFGASVCFCAYSHWSGWQMVLPGGGEESIPEPEMIYLDEDYAKNNPRDITKKTFKRISLKRIKEKQMLLFP